MDAVLVAIPSVSNQQGSPASIAPALNHQDTISHFFDRIACVFELLVGRCEGIPCIHASSAPSVAGESASEQ